MAGIYLVFEYCQHDLAGILEWKNRDLALSEVKCVAHQLLSGLSHLHTYCSVLHRDVKPANLLVSADGVVKIADFGLARGAVQPNCGANPLVEGFDIEPVPDFSVK